MTFPKNDYAWVQTTDFFVEKGRGNWTFGTIFACYAFLKMVQRSVQVVSCKL